MIRAFYSTAEYENRLKEGYELAVKKKQDEINKMQKQTNKIQKYTGRAYVFKPQRIFYVEEDGCIYYEEIHPDRVCPTEKVKGGEKYVLDSNFDYYIMKFLEKHKRYKVIFSPDGSYGPTFCYCSSIGAIPARLESYDGEVLILDDESKYDICAA